MATTENFLNGDGTAIEFSFSFPYIKTEDVRVELQEIDSTQPINNQIISSTAVTLFTIPSNNPTVIQFDSLSAATNYQAITGAPLANHAINTGNTIRIRIYRSTSTTATPATFFSGGAIRSQDLNDNFDSILYITQEKENELTEVIAGGIADGSITSSKLADQSVGTLALVDGGVATVDLADNAVTPAKLSTGGPGWTSSGALGLNGANYGTQYQIAQSNGSGAASTWVNRSVIDTEVNLVSSPLNYFKNIAFNTDALEWANKIDIYFRDVSCSVDIGSLIIKPLNDQNVYFPTNSLVGFISGTVYNTTVDPSQFTPNFSIMQTYQGIFIGWGVAASTRYGRVTLARSQSTVWMVDAQVMASTNPTAGLFYQGHFQANGFQVVSPSDVLGGVQFAFDSGNIDSGAVSVHYS